MHFLLSRRSRYRLIERAWTSSPVIAGTLIKTLAPLAGRRGSFALTQYQSSFIKAGRQLRCWWVRGPLPGNLGDLLTPVILSHLFDVVPIFCPNRSFLGVGSIVHKARAGSVVWGSGLIAPDADDSASARYLAVRGPLTRQILRGRGRIVPDVYGDPSLLMPLVYHPNLPTAYDVGVLPHYLHVCHMAQLPREVPLIDIRVGCTGEIFHCIDQILRCEVIASSSLHGLILAVAYRRKFIWLRDPTDPLIGDTFKFEDFFSSIGLKGVAPVEWSPARPLPTDLLRHAIVPQVRHDLVPTLLEVLQEYLDEHEYD